MKDGDRYWCTEGCGFVSDTHRCEQWSNVLRIPSEAVQELVAPLEQRVSRARRILWFVANNQNPYADTSSEVRRAIKVLEGKVE